MQRALTISLIAAAALAAPLPAHAHLMNTGFGPFYDGATHLFVTPEDLLPVLGLALLAGLRGPRFGRALLLVLPLAWLAGSVAGTLFSSPATLPAAPAVLSVALGASVAADWRLPVPLLVGCALLLGLLAGGLNGIELMQTTGSALNAAGTACALFVLISVLAGQVASMRAEWLRVAVRVAGSWIAAIGLLMFGWSVRGA
jgi:urease accessory protein